MISRMMRMSRSTPPPMYNFILLVRGRGSGWAVRVAP
jgi:hypothetical protein